MSYAGYGFNNMSTSETKTVKHPSSSLLVIDSEDRNVATSAQVSATNAVEVQPYNNFIIQTPDRLATGGICRIMPKMIRFPWFIPNIVPSNSTFNILLNQGVPGIAYPTTTVNINLTTAVNTFVSPDELADFINAEIVAQAPAYTLVVAWFPSKQAFGWSLNGLTYRVRFQATNQFVNGTNPLTSEQFYAFPNLLKTMGFTPAALDPTTFISNVATGFIFYPGGGTDFLYTRYVDICSSRLLQYRKLIDGASKNSNKKPIIARIYCANENSMNSYDLSGNIIPIGSQPFIIHRSIHQKDIAWNSEATVDYLDFQVFDEYGQLVQLPSVTLNGVNTLLYTYPSFQMTFALSE
jgi:hypothetical protein